jgi:hypothetical protein
MLDVRLQALVTTSEFTEDKPHVVPQGNAAYDASSQDSLPHSIFRSRRFHGPLG